MHKKAGYVPVAISVRFDRPAQEPDYDLLLGQADHPLIHASSAVLEKVKSDREHNECLVQLGHTCHRGSRANNVIALPKFQTLARDLEYSRGFANPMNGRPVNAGNLYRLKTGPRQKAFLGANLFDFSPYYQDDQLYIATEAPYHPDDYFRMVMDTGSRVLVSVTSEDDNREDVIFFKIRDGIPIDLHHLSPGNSCQTDDNCFVTCLHEVKRASRFGGDSFTVAHYRVNKKSESYLVHHIKYKSWPDNYPGHSSYLLDLIAAIDDSQQELQAHSRNPVTVNCGFGYGRTASLILMHQISRMIPGIIKSHCLTPNNMIHDEDIQLDLWGMMHSLQEQLAYKALIGLGENPEERFNKFYIEVQRVVGALIRQKLA